MTGRKVWPDILKETEAINMRKFFEALEKALEEYYDTFSR